MDKYVFAKQQTQQLTVVFVVGGPAAGKQTQCLALHRSDPATYPLISMREVRPSLLRLLLGHYVQAN